MIRKVMNRSPLNIPFAVSWIALVTQTTLTGTCHRLIYMAITMIFMSNFSHEYPVLDIQIPSHRICLKISGVSTQISRIPPNKRQNLKYSISSSQNGVFLHPLTRKMKRDQIILEIFCSEPNMCEILSTTTDGIRTRSRAERFHGMYLDTGAQKSVIRKA